MPAPPTSPSYAEDDRRAWAIFMVFLRLGLTSFGGPIAHLGYFREEFVQRRRWLSDTSYADLVALCQFLPGPASSQVGLALGLSRAGYAGAAAAWAGFTLPSAAGLMTLAYGLGQFGAWLPAGVLHGLKVVAVAVVAQAVWGMAQKICTDAWRVGLALLAAATVLLWPGVWGQLLVLIVAGMAGVLGGALLRHRPPLAPQENALPIAISRRAGALWLASFAALLLVLPLLAQATQHAIGAQIAAFYRAGALVFGGGHVVLPLLQAAVVPPGWVSNDAFLAGYGAAQAVPGPLFTFAAFLGAAMPADVLPRWAHGLLLLLVIMLPSFLLVAGALPFWADLRRNAHMQAALGGINAAVVGILLAALYQPVWTSAIHRPVDAVLALLALLALMKFKLPPWLVVLGTAVGGWVMALWLP